MQKNNRKKIILVANWKCNPATLREAERLFRATVNVIPKNKNTEVVICPPYVFLSRYKIPARPAGGQDTRYKLGSQDVFWEETGAYTGEIGPRMLKSAGVSHVIIGHSERRELFGETNETVQKKTAAALKAGLSVIICVGERTREGDASVYISFIKEEVASALRDVPKSALSRVIIAYEPIWAVGSDEPDTPHSALEMAIYIRKTAADAYGRSLAQQLPVLYGGSVSASNAGAFLRDGGVDGLLVGRASLHPKEFGKIVKITQDINK
ncbi:MAG: triose-phosphate isomerase [Patescibacteria group bacterium]